MDTNETEHSGLGRARLYAMAVASGIAVANIYYNQPLLGLIEAEFPGEPAIGLLPTATQLGYALGLLLLLPLGDIVRRRRLIVGQFLAIAIAAAAAALAQSPFLLIVASVLLGASATVAQQIVPIAAMLSKPDKRGAAIGTVMAGVLTGILLSRTISGFVGAHAGWREMFWASVPLALAASLLMVRTLPDLRSALRLPYREALVSLVTLWRREPALRLASVVQAALFASFTAFWTVLALYLATPRFNLGADAAGLFGIVGAIGVFAAPIAGRVADRRGARSVVWLGAALTLSAWGVLGAWASLAGLVIGVIVLDIGIQVALIANQHIIYALEPAARSRINTVFMTSMFLGGSAGSALSFAAWSYGAWFGVSVLGLALAGLALAAMLLARRAARLAISR
ncbi:MFS transporter [Ensifer adhaerens]|uniref:MFS transporter n=1 Tax=Ensifer adhaerens TaxID=106592 RepID=UPI001CBCFDC6|nr:MFS transporter [Ensifer adhaerens]MBZ7925116.1 MFS transporter [Ensifer adhaerens]UAX95697.1 MFS transporter [Ensifer adhaerens]UAY04962.1 MFS transporter [Ensifer adhaerens]UAY10394.1 MFS transporter [Ensifer adhaerens]